VYLLCGAAHQARLPLVAAVAAVAADNIAVGHTVVDIAVGTVADPAVAGIVVGTAADPAAVDIAVGTAADPAAVGIAPAAAAGRELQVGMYQLQPVFRILCRNGKFPLDLFRN